MRPIEQYLGDYPRARTTEERTVCIDQLIHAFYISLQTGRLNRSIANNLNETTCIHHPSKTGVRMVISF